MSKHAKSGDSPRASMPASKHRTYGAYGAHDAVAAAARTAFAGERYDVDTAWYLLGGRAYCPTLRRFLAPDRLSPFGRGGINRYAYCEGDPINRVDPSGNAPHGWLGVIGTLRAAARLRDAGGAAPTASGSMEAATTTPGALASRVAAVEATVSVTSAVVPTSMTSGPPKARGLHGRAGSVSAAEGTALPPARRRKSRSEIVEEDDNLVRGRPSVIMHQGIQVLRNTRVPDSRIGARKFGWPYVQARWSARVHRTNPDSMILAADSKTYALDYGALLGRMQELGVKSFTHYTGTHGGLLGQNWDIESQQPLAPERAMFERDKAYMEKASIEFGMAISVVDIGGWTIEQFREAISGNGVHALANCFGLVDPAVRQEFNLPIVTLYDL